MFLRSSFYRIVKTYQNGNQYFEFYKLCSCGTFRSSYALNSIPHVGTYTYTDHQVQDKKFDLLKQIVESFIGSGTTLIGDSGFCNVPFSIWGTSQNLGVIFVIKTLQQDYK